MLKSQRIYLNDIIDSINAIIEYTSNLGEENFSVHKMVQDAVLRRLTILGEAVKRLSLGFKQKHKEINWKIIAGSRDIIVHKYDGIDYSIIWNVIIKDLPILKEQIERIIQEEDK